MFDLGIIVIDASVFFKLEIPSIPLKICNIGVILLDVPHWHEFVFRNVHISKSIPPSILILIEFLLKLN